LENKKKEQFEYLKDENVIEELVINLKHLILF